MKNSQISEDRCDKIRSYEKDDDTFFRIRLFNGNWVLHQFNFACEKCVYDGEAQYEGELLTVYDLAINFCPYCGAFLNESLLKSGNLTEQVEDDLSHNVQILKSIIINSLTLVLALTKMQSGKYVKILNIGI